MFFVLQCCEWFYALSDVLAALSTAHKSSFVSFGDDHCFYPYQVHQTACAVNQGLDYCLQ